MSGYHRKRGTNKKKDTNQLDDDLIALDKVDLDACWRIYNLNESGCEAHIPPNPKTRNCRLNPFCIYRLGLEKFDKCLQAQKVEASSSNSEPLTRRNPNLQPCGLVNYGNFCYVNSFLQIWFNDLRFRQCVYDWRADPFWEKPVESKLDIQDVMCCLQRLFLTLELTPFETTDAKEFCQLLRLDNQQQDVQEFHTLFFDTIEKNLLFHPNGERIQTSIRQLFQSRMRQTISCECGHSTNAESEYRSLFIIIDGFNSLITAIESFFKAELLADYKCSNCGEQGKSVKTMEYTTLPQVLIIQLNRYVFKGSNERHHKLKTVMQYPRLLKANKLKPDALFNDEYELCAVMIHEGNNTHCGHYYDLIRDPYTKQWFTYNDKVLHVQLEKRAPGYEGHREPKENSGRPTADQKGCYALIYQRRPAYTAADVMSSSKKLNMPPDEIVQEVKNKLESDFIRESKEANRSMQLWESRVSSRHSYLNDLFRELEVKDGNILLEQPEEISFLPTSLLTNLFSNEYEAVKEMHNLNEIDNTLINNNMEEGEIYSFDYADYEYIYAPEPLNSVKITLCKHGKVPLDIVKKGELKAVKTVGLKRLISDFNVQWKLQMPDNDDELMTNIDGIDDFRLLTGADLCSECVKDLKLEANFRRSLIITEKTLSDAFKSLQKRTHDPSRPSPFPLLSPPEDSVWVSVDHLKRFKKIALTQMEKSGRLSKNAEEDPPAEKRLRAGSDIEEDIVEDGELPEEHRQSTSNVFQSSSDIQIVSEYINNSPMCENVTLRNRRPSSSLDLDNNNENEPPNSSNIYNKNDSFAPLERVESLSVTEIPDDGTIRFNEDLLCKHGRLSYKPKRAWLTKDEWGVLKSNFMEFANPFSCSSQECPDCIEEYNVLSEVRQSNLDQLQKLLNEINPLLKNLLTRKWSPDELGLTYKFMLCSDFHSKMKNITNRSKQKQIVEIPRICQDCILCQHGRPYLPLLPSENKEENNLLFDQVLEAGLDQKQSKKQPNGVPLMEDEWQQLVDAYIRHVPEQPEPNPILFQEDGHYMEFCDDCHNQYFMNEEQKRYMYPDGAEIWVKLKDDESEEQLQAKAAGPGTSSSSYTTRRVAMRSNMYKFKMRSTQTVTDLKLQLMQKTKQSPNDQLLYMNNKALENDQTLGTARVAANNYDNPLVLIVQQRRVEDLENSTSSSSGGNTTTRQLEKGFRDTALSA
uniref:ubiquitinyl hydrolase 1 n=1 Tax=Meloidogyne hapla TaxID=6305 RepID=A0A1I8BYJ5_MELHA